MPRAATHSPEVEQARSSIMAIGGYALIPILACIYATVIFPLIIVSCDPTDSACLMEARPESKIFWPALAAIALVLAIRNFSRLTSTGCSAISHWPPPACCGRSSRKPRSFALRSRR